LLVVPKEENTSKPQLHRVFWKSWKCQHFTSRATRGGFGCHF